jgi:hypothetical protein
MTGAEHRRVAADRLSSCKSDLYQATNTQTIVTRLIEVVDALAIFILGKITDGNPNQTPGLDARLLDDPTKIRVEFTSGPGAVQQQREREAEARKRAQIIAAQRVRQARAASPSNWYEEVERRLDAVKSALSTSAGSIVLARDRAREICEVLVWIATTSNAPAASALYAQVAADLHPAVYPNILRDRIRALIDAVELSLLGEITEGAPRVDPGTPLDQLEDVRRAKVEIVGPIGRAEQATRPDVQLIGRDTLTLAPARVELTVTAPLNDTQRVQFLDAAGRTVDVNGKLVELDTTASAPAAAVEPAVQLIETTVVEAAVVETVVVEPTVVPPEKKRAVGEGVRNWP